MFYREPVQIDKYWSSMFRFFSVARVISWAADFCQSLKFLYFRTGQAVKHTIAIIQLRGNRGMNDPFGVFLRYKFPDFTKFV